MCSAINLQLARLKDKPLSPSAACMSMQPVRVTSAALSRSLSLSLALPRCNWLRLEPPNTPISTLGLKVPGLPFGEQEGLGLRPALCPLQVMLIFDLVRLRSETSLCDSVSKVGRRKEPRRTWLHALVTLIGSLGGGPSRAYSPPSQ